ncbi:MAG: GHKL domain-containing protein [Solobacterium sp.]|nr:GHKL domain-containing protein [Solobacterium sp.]
MTPTAVFEELRYVWELIIAQAVFLYPMLKKKEKSLLLVLVEMAAFSLVAMGYFPIRTIAIEQSLLGRSAIHIAWYSFLELLTIAYMKYSFSLTWSDALYIGTCGYAAMHLVYVFVHEILYLGLLPQLSEQFLIYFLLTVFNCFLLYYLLYRIFSPWLQRYDGLRIPDNLPVIIALTIVLIQLIVCSFTGQHVFRSGPLLNYAGAAMDGIFCIAILLVEYITIRMMCSLRDTAVMERLLHESEAHYTFTKEVMEQIRKSSHDMKHVLQALAVMSPEEQQDYIRHETKVLEQFDELVHTKNEVLNTILTEKSILCRSRGIRFSCSADDTDLGFRSISDLYILLGNALDNAIEYVEHYEEKEKRLVTVSLKRNHSFFSIQVTNCFDGSLQMQDGLPETTKADRMMHGIGLRSIRSIADKYHGAMCIDASDGMFTLQVTIPVI